MPKCIQKKSKMLFCLSFWKYNRFFNSQVNSSKPQTQYVTGSSLFHMPCPLVAWNTEGANIQSIGTDPSSPFRYEEGVSQHSYEHTANQTG